MYTGIPQAYFVCRLLEGMVEMFISKSIKKQVSSIKMVSERDYDTSYFPTLVGKVLSVTTTSVTGHPTPDKKMKALFNITNSRGVQVSFKQIQKNLIKNPT